MLSSVRNRTSLRSTNEENVRLEAAPTTDHWETSSKPANDATTIVMASLYILSGVTQPLIMTLVKKAGLADPSCQLYMLFYYLGPASIVLRLVFDKGTVWPCQKTLYKALVIACCDLVSQTINYTGSSMAGPTLFSIIYSSVAIWTAVLSRILLSRRLTIQQWCGVVIVFCGLALTGFDSASMGSQVWTGSLLVVLGSMWNAFTYILSESIMKGKEQLSVQVNCAIQASVGFIVLLLWQIVYTRPRYEALIQSQMEKTQTTTLQAVGVLLSFAIANLIHYMAFFYTLKHFSGGATSAGVMKALQSVLVFAFTSLVYCGIEGGSEMCFSSTKLASLIVVVGGVVLFGKSTATTSVNRKLAREGYSKKESNVEEG